MMDLQFPNGQAQQWAVLTCLLSGAMLCVALYMELIMDLAPCPLCMMQRLWVALAGLFAYLSLLHNPRWGIYPVLGIGAAITGAYFSGKQLWLQSLPEDQVPACGPDLQYMLDSFPLADVWIAMTQGTGDCAQVSWSLFGISIPGWTLLGFALIVFTLTLQLRHGTR